MKKILLVDDDHDMLDVVKLILIQNGFNVRTNSNGYNLPQMINEYNPDIILLDVRLPGKPGTELCKELKETFSLPVILFSAEPKILFNEWDADDFIQKPFEINHLITVIKSHLEVA
jgi:DNA-binding response OmpR family regulator